MMDEWERLSRAKADVESQLGVVQPRVGIVLGSGLGRLAQDLDSPVSVPYQSISSMPEPKVLGHGGQLLLGTLGGTLVACLSGRSHLYEGHEPNDVVFGVRLLARLGIECAIVTNAAGGIGRECTPGALMVIEDHLNLTGRSPLLGPNDDRIGPRFPDMSVAYDEKLRELIATVAKEEGIPLTRGVYAGLLGPTYETPAEIRMLETLGAHAVGMSTVLETIALRHMGVRVLGVSCITNYAAGKSAGTLSHQEVGEVAQKASSRFSRLIGQFTARLGAE